MILPRNASNNSASHDRCVWEGLNRIVEYFCKVTRVRSSVRLKNGSIVRSKAMVWADYRLVRSHLQPNTPVYDICGIV